MALRIELKPGERLLIGESIITNGDQRACHCEYPPLSAFAAAKLPHDRSQCAPKAYYFYGEIIVNLGAKFDE